MWRTKYQPSWCSSSVTVFLVMDHQFVKIALCFILKPLFRAAFYIIKLHNAHQIWSVQYNWTQYKPIYRQSLVWKCEHITQPSENNVCVWKSCVATRAANEYSAFKFKGCVANSGENHKTQIMATYPTSLIRKCCTCVQSQICLQFKPLPALRDHVNCVLTQKKI